MKRSWDEEIRRGRESERKRENWGKKRERVSEASAEKRDGGQPLATALLSHPVCTVFGNCEGGLLKWRPESS